MAGEFCETGPARVGAVILMPKPEDAFLHWQQGFAQAAPDVLIDTVPLRLRDDPRQGGVRWSELEEFGAVEDVLGNLEGVVITGANVERGPDGQLLPIDDVDFYQPLEPVIGRAIEDENIRLLLASCWGAHAVLRHTTGQDLRRLGDEKLIDVVDHTVHMPDHPTVQGMDGLVAPHGRWASVPAELLVDHGFDVIADHPTTGWLIAAKPKPGGWIVLWQGHPEYPQKPKNAPLEELLRGIRDGEPIQDVSAAKARLETTGWSQTNRGLFRNVGGLLVPQGVLV